MSRIPQHMTQQEFEEEMYRQQMMDDQEIPLAYRILGYTFQGIGLGMTLLKYGWLPFTIYIGASSAYCSPALDVASMFAAPPPQ